MTISAASLRSRKKRLSRREKSITFESRGNGCIYGKDRKVYKLQKEDDQEDLNDRVSRLAVDLNNAYYKEGNHPFEDVHDGFIRSIEALYEEYDIPLRPVLKEAIDALRKESNSDPCPDMQ